jgi:hypothetical protein
MVITRLPDRNHRKINELQFLTRLPEVLQTASCLFQSVGCELDIVEYVKHEMIDWHRVLRCTRFLGLFFATYAAKYRLDYRSWFWGRSIQQGNSVGVILNDASAGIAANLWAYMALVIYLEYKCHERQTTVRLTGQQTAFGRPERPINYPSLRGRSWILRDQFAVRTARAP